MLAAATLAPVVVGASGATVTLHAVSKNPIVTGDTWVTYGRPGFTHATIRGTASGVAPGAVARLLAQSFPFHTPAKVVGSSALMVAHSSASFAFNVAPLAATHYRVKVFAHASASSAEAVSAAVTVYVAFYGTGSSAERCNSRTCTLHMHLVYVMPTSAVPVERSKHQFAYLSLPRSANGAQPKATTYRLTPASVSGPTVSGHDERFVLTITYAEPHYRYWYYWQTCSRDTIAKDGLGLPGYHGCGKHAVSPSTPYLG